ncbi:MAG: DAK2 domain-containing protein [Anaerolineae bacterium]|nr:DAK2 domain-containing protein [Anaerolineae bacterium]
MSTQTERTSVSPETSAHSEARTAQRLALDGRRLKELVRAAYLWLRQQEAVVNSYNVYPVPDGDTGTNMMHTMRSAWEAIATLDEPNIGAVAKAASNGALRGSRGNSGIILSQLWRGFARSLDGKDICDAQDLAAAFQEAARTAYSGVSTPVEGTILTVARELAEAVAVAAHRTHDLRKLLEVAKDAAYDAVQRTPQMLKILKDAGVVDSGGYGLYVILEGVWRSVNGLPVETPEASVETSGLNREAESALQREGGWGYDVQYLIYARPGKPLDVDQIRADIEAMGECPLVMGDAEVVKVHVHVPDPGVPISYGARWGSLRDVVVEDMQAQSEAFVPAGLAKPVQPPPEPELPPAAVAMVAVASGAGLTRLFRELGARVVVEGGQTMNPSVEDFLGAIRRARADAVIVLPNNGNIIMTAEQAARMSEVSVHVLPTKTIPQGVAAALAFNAALPVEALLETMRAPIAQVTTVEITKATRTVTLNGVNAQEGQYIGLVDDALRTAGDDIVEVTLAALHSAGAAHAELITLYHGNGLEAAAVEAIAERVRAAFPRAQVDLVAGDQPHYYFIIGVE